VKIIREALSPPTRLRNGDQRYEDMGFFSSRKAEDNENYVIAASGGTGGGSVVHVIRSRFVSLLSHSRFHFIRFAVRYSRFFHLNVSSTVGKARNAKRNHRHIFHLRMPPWLRPPRLAPPPPLHDPVLQTGHRVLAYYVTNIITPCRHRCLPPSQRPESGMTPISKLPAPLFGKRRIRLRMFFNSAFQSALFLVHHQ
jgi:hypothetical protein